MKKHGSRCKGFIWRIRGEEEGRGGRGSGGGEKGGGGGRRGGKEKREELP